MLHPGFRTPPPRSPATAARRAASSAGGGRLFAGSLDAVQVGGADVTGDVVAVEARRFEALECRIAVAYRLLQVLQALVDQRVGTDLAPDLVFAARVAMSSARVGMSMP